jgi:hypothetical protein
MVVHICNPSSGEMEAGGLTSVSRYWMGLLLVTIVTLLGIIKFG